MSMIVTSRLFTREAPSREARSIFIYCEGKKKEFNYFRFFAEKDSRLNLVVYELDHDQDNSPTGLFKIAKEELLGENKSQNYEDGDQVWFVVDTDEWGKKLDELKNLIEEFDNWQLAQSNPCFETWLYYHQEKEIPANMEELNTCTEWKPFLNEVITGGFSMNKHPIYILDAIKNSKRNYSEENGAPSLATTQVFNVAESFVDLIQSKIKRIIESEGL